MQTWSHHQSESAVLQLVGSLYFRRIPFSDYLEITTTDISHVAAVKYLPINQYSVIIYIFSSQLGLLGSDI